MPEAAIERHYDYRPRSTGEEILRSVKTIAMVKGQE